MLAWSARCWKYETECHRSPNTTGGRESGKVSVNFGHAPHVYCSSSAELRGCRRLADFSRNKAHELRSCWRGRRSGIGSEWQHVLPRRRVNHQTGFVRKSHVFREPSGGANGLLFDHQGRLIVCEYATATSCESKPMVRLPS